MMSAKSRSTSENPYAERLERVREMRGFDTLKDFWKELIKGGDFEISYEAVRSYHSTDRHPSVEYLARVAKVFGIRVEWLASGRGEPDPLEYYLKSAERTGELDEMPEPVTALVKEYPALQGLPPHLISLFSDTWGRYQRYVRGFRPTESQDFEVLMGLYGEKIGEHIASLPFQQEGVVPDFSSTEFSDYVLAALQAINLALKVPLDEESDDGR